MSCVGTRVVQSSPSLFTEILEDETLPVGCRGMALEDSRKSLNRPGRVQSSGIRSTPCRYSRCIPDRTVVLVPLWSDWPARLLERYFRYVLAEPPGSSGSPFPHSPDEPLKRTRGVGQSDPSIMEHLMQPPLTPDRSDSEVGISTSEDNRKDKRVSNASFLSGILRVRNALHMRRSKFCRCSL
jgi:hypothetical protein